LYSARFINSGRIVKFELDVDTSGREWQRPQDAFADDFSVLADAIITAIQTQRIEFPFQPANKPAESQNSIHHSTGIGVGLSRYIPFA